MMGQKSLNLGFGNPVQGLLEVRESSPFDYLELSWLKARFADAWQYLLILRQAKKVKTGFPLRPLAKVSARRVVIYILAWKNRSYHAIYFNDGGFPVARIIEHYDGRACIFALHYGRYIVLESIAGRFGYPVGN